MAKLVVTEVYEGTNDEIKELKAQLDSIVESESHEEMFGEIFKSVDSEVTLDSEKTKGDTPLQVHLKKELDLYRSILNADAIEQTQKLIDEASSSTLTEQQVADLELRSGSVLGDLYKSSYSEEFDNEDDDNEDDYFDDEDDKEDDDEDLFSDFENIFSA